MPKFVIVACGNCGLKLRVPKHEEELVVTRIKPMTI
jgi:hypothetical protein